MKFRLSNVNLYHSIQISEHMKMTRFITFTISFKIYFPYNKPNANYYTTHYIYKSNFKFILLMTSNIKHKYNSNIKIN